MGRLVQIHRSSGTIGASAANDRQTYMEQVVKYIPAEIIGAFVAINGFLTGLEPGILHTCLWINFGLCAVLTPVYLWRQSKLGDALATNLIISFISFCIWAYTITGETGVFGTTGLNVFYNQLASVALVVFSLIAPLFTPKVPS